MDIKDIKGKYIIKVDYNRNIVYETLINYWKPEDVERLHNEYVTTIVPLFRGKPWRKCCDLRSYQVSMITEEIQDHVSWAIENGFTEAVLIYNEQKTDTPAIELQMMIGSKHVPLTLLTCKTLEEAETLLNQPTSQSKSFL